MTLVDGRARFRAGEVRQAEACPVCVPGDLTAIRGEVPVSQVCGVKSGRVTSAAFGRVHAPGHKLITDRPAEETL